MTDGSYGERSGAASPAGPSVSGAAVDPPVIEAAEARVAVDDVVSIERLTFTSRGARVLFVGDVTALFAALGGVPLSARAGLGERDGPPGEARIVSGSVRVAGRDVATGAHVELTGVAPLDPPLPPGWTFEEYLAWSARLSGARPRLALELARATSDRLGLGPLRSRHLAGLALPERRALVLCAAVLSSPRVLVAEAPLAGLDGAGAALVMSTVSRATEGRGAVLSVRRLDPGTPEGVLARGATDLAVVAGGELALDGDPAGVLSGARVYGLTVRTNTEPLRAELAARGVELRGGPLRFSAALAPGQGTREILAAASAARAAIVELVPLL